MTWFSRLSSTDRRASRRMSNRRRRMMNLERLESRLVLSAVTVDPVSSTGTLMIHGDTGNDNFQIIEQPGGLVQVKTGLVKMVPGVGIVQGSSINGGTVFNSLQQVKTIIVDLPGTNNFDFVSLSDTGNSSVHDVTVSAHAPNLTFTASGVSNAGALTISDLATTPVNGVLHATVSSSSFTAITITQQGNGPDSSDVTLQNDTAQGNVLVSLGDASGDSIKLLGNNNFGQTTLLEGNGNNGQAPNTPADAAGDNDVIQVVGPTATGTGNKYKSLYAEQMLNGNNNKITISGVVVAAFAPLPHPGVTTVQHDGNNDITSILGVNTFGPTPPVNLPLPPGFGDANIEVTQGAGVSDQASVKIATVPGHIWIHQSDVLGNPPDTATIDQGHAGTYLEIVQGDAGTLADGGDSATINNSSSGTFARIAQGMGTGDTATISNSTIGTDASITQDDQSTNLAGDTAKIKTNTIGGSASINQGGAAGDYANIDPGSVGGDATISQGDGSGDTAIVDLTSVGGNVSITQGTGDGDSASVDLGTVDGSVTITQTDGAGDIATIAGPGSIGGDATIGQGTGAGDVAVIKFATIGGNISITQTDGAGDAAEIEDVTDNFGTSISISQGNGDGDVAAIVHLVANGGDLDFGIPVEISITQGTGSGDFAEIADVTGPYNLDGTLGGSNVYGNVTISQSDLGTNAVGDTALVLGVDVGIAPGNVDQFGNVTITQGDAPGDVALVKDGVANNVSISQGANVQTYNGSTVALDVAEVDDETVTSDITILQGLGTASDGWYVAAIANDFVGAFGLVTLPSVPEDFTPLVAPSVGSSDVTAGGFTTIVQTGGFNTVLLGDSSDLGGQDASFTTTFLSVYMGDLGGSYAQVLNTTVFWGFYPNIDGGNADNQNLILIDGYSLGTVSWNTSTFDDLQI